MARINEIVVDALNPPALARFWANMPDDGQTTHPIWRICRVADSRPIRIRQWPSMEAAQRFSFNCRGRAKSPGTGSTWICVATRAPQKYRGCEGFGASVRDVYETHTVMLDPEGNEFCGQEPRGDQRLKDRVRMANKNEHSRYLEEDISVHILSVSAAMVGVCLTVIGLLRVVITIQRANTVADDLLAADSILFLISCLLSYWALRTRTVRRMHNVERIADAVFMLALILMVVVCAFVTFAISAL